MPAKFKVGTICIFSARGADRWDLRAPVKEGQTVKVIQPAGCPRNGTMGHAFIGEAATGRFIGMVLEASLSRRGPA